MNIHSSSAAAVFLSGRLSVMNVLTVTTASVCPTVLDIGYLSSEVSCISLEVSKCMRSWLYHTFVKGMGIDCRKIKLLVPFLAVFSPGFPSAIHTALMYTYVMVLLSYGQMQTKTLTRSKVSPSLPGGFMSVEVCYRYELLYSNGRSFRCFTRTECWTTIPHTAVYCTYMYWMRLRSTNGTSLFCLSHMNGSASCPPVVTR